MESFYLITPIALILIAVAIKLFIWAVNSGQFDDLDREASRILFDDDVANARKKSEPTHSESSNKESEANEITSTDSSQKENS